LYYVCIVAASYVGKEVRGQQNKEKSDKTVKIKSPRTERWGFLKLLPKLKIIFFPNNFSLYITKLFWN